MSARRESLKAWLRSVGCTDDWLCWAIALAFIVGPRLS